MAKKNFCGRFSLVTNGTKNKKKSKIVTEANRNQWPMAKVVDINTDAKGFV